MQLSSNLQSNIFWNNFTASLCISQISSQKEDNCPAKKNACSRSTRQKQYKSCEMCIKVTVKRMSDTGANSLDVALVPLLLSFNIGIKCRLEVS